MVILLSVTNDRRWGDGWHGWQSLCVEWPLSRVSGLFWCRRWGQNNIPCGPWGVWDVESLILAVYLYSSPAYALQMWRQANSSPHGALQPWWSWACVRDLRDAATNSIQIPVQLLPGWGGAKIPWISTDLLREEILELAFISSGLSVAILRAGQTGQHS